ncbi:MAG: hypothetical protein BWZ02_02555 [Lentisphaerae bacterium ADurb.BinA184]|nr:MAG: hypothetical protein BWZ02_02555 [Lentisphaerae bacterium ADurb.BinA184]
MQDCPLLALHPADRLPGFGPQQAVLAGRVETASGQLACRGRQLRQVKAQPAARARPQNRAPAAHRVRRLGGGQRLPAVGRDPIVAQLDKPLAVHSHQLRLQRQRPGQQPRQRRRRVARHALGQPVPQGHKLGDRLAAGRHPQPARPNRRPRQALDQALDSPQVRRGLDHDREAAADVAERRRRLQRIQPERHAVESERDHDLRLLGLRGDGQLGGRLLPLDQVAAQQVEPVVNQGRQMLADVRPPHARRLVREDLADNPRRQRTVQPEPVPVEQERPGAARQPRRDLVEGRAPAARQDHHQPDLHPVLAGRAQLDFDAGRVAALHERLLRRALDEAPGAVRPLALPGLKLVGPQLEDIEVLPDLGATADPSRQPGQETAVAVVPGRRRPFALAATQGEVQDLLQAQHFAPLVAEQVEAERDHAVLVV